MVTATARGVLLYGLSICPSVHPSLFCEHNMSGMPCGNFNISNTKVFLGSRMDGLEFGGQRWTLLWRCNVALLTITGLRNRGGDHDHISYLVWCWIANTKPGYWVCRSSVLQSCRCVWNTCFTIYGVLPQHPCSKHLGSKENTHCFCWCSALDDFCCNI